MINPRPSFKRGRKKNYLQKTKFKMENFHTKTEPLNFCKKMAQTLMLMKFTTKKKKRRIKL